MLADAQWRLEEERLRAQAQWRPQLGVAPAYEVGRLPAPPPPPLVGAQPPIVSPFAPLSSNDPLAAQLGAPPPPSGGWNVVSRPAPWAPPAPLLGGGIPLPPALLPDDAGFAPPVVAQFGLDPGAVLPALTGIAPDPYRTPLRYLGPPYPAGLRSPYPVGYAAGNPYAPVYVNGVWYRPWEVPQQYGGPAGSSYPYAADPSSLYASGYPASPQAYAVDYPTGRPLPYVPSPNPFGIYTPVTPTYAEVPGPNSMGVYPPLTPTYAEVKSTDPRVYINGVWYRPWEVPRQYGGPAGSPSAQIVSPVPLYASAYPGSAQAYAAEYLQGSTLPTVPTYPFGISPPYTPTYAEGASPYDRVYINGLWYRPWEVPRQYGGPAGQGFPYSTSPYAYNPAAYAAPSGIPPYVSAAPYPYGTGNSYMHAAGTVDPRLVVRSYPYAGSNVSGPYQTFADPVPPLTRSLTPLWVGILVGLPSSELVPAGRMAFQGEVALDLALPGGLAFPADNTLVLPQARIPFAADLALPLPPRGRIPFAADAALVLPQQGRIAFAADPALGVPLQGRMAFPADPVLGLAPAGRTAFSPNPAPGWWGPLVAPRPLGLNAGSPLAAGPGPAPLFVTARPPVLVPSGRPLTVPPVGDRLPPRRDVGLATSQPAPSSPLSGATGESTASQSLVAAGSPQRAPDSPAPSVPPDPAPARPSGVDLSRTEPESAVAGLGVSQPPALAQVRTLPSTGALVPAAASPLGAVLSFLALVAGAGMWRFGRRRAT
jgi:hypothetical protein